MASADSFATLFITGSWIYVYYTLRETEHLPKCTETFSEVLCAVN